MVKCRVVTTVALFIALTLPMAAQGQADCYNTPPPELVRLVDGATRDIVTSREADRLNQKYVEMVSWAIADARRGSIQTNIRALEAYRYLGETARTDKQVGASPTANGTTSAIEKPGLINLLGIAIEHGAIQQEVSDTSVTLSTSPYAIIAAFEGDTPDTYNKYELFNRVSASATFNLEDTNNVLVNIRKKQLSEWSIKVRLSGDRSTRSAQFQEFWDTKIGPVIQQRIDVTQDIVEVVANDDSLSSITDTTVTDGPPARLKAEITAYLNSNPTDSAEKQAAASAVIKGMILCYLKERVFDPVQAGKIQVSGDTLTALNTSFVNLAKVNAQIAVARKELADFLDRFRKEGNLSSFTYRRQRMEMGSDVSELKFLFERHVKPLDLIFNSALSLYHDPDPMKNQEKVRDFNFALSLEGSSRNPFRIVEDLSRITYSVTGRYERLKENESMPDRAPDISSLQLRMEVPISYGLSIPVAFTYSSATEMSMKSEKKFNIGLHLDIDKLFALRRARSNL